MSEIERTSAEAKAPEQTFSPLRAETKCMESVRLEIVALDRRRAELTEELAGYYQEAATRLGLGPVAYGPGGDPALPVFNWNRDRNLFVVIQPAPRPVAKPKKVEPDKVIEMPLHEAHEEKTPCRTSAPRSRCPTTASSARPRLLERPAHTPLHEAHEEKTPCPSSAS